jgi:hypothetical protein
MLERDILKKEDWKPVRFSDEVHFELRILGKAAYPGKDTVHMNCIQGADSPKDKGSKETALFGPQQVTMYVRDQNFIASQHNATA